MRTKYTRITLAMQTFLWPEFCQCNSRFIEAFSKKNSILSAPHTAHIGQSNKRKYTSNIEVLLFMNAWFGLFD